MSFDVCGLLSIGCSILVPIAFGVCPLMVEVGQGTYAGLLVGGTDVCPLVGGAGSCPSDVQGCVKQCVLRWLCVQYDFRQPVS